MNALMMHALHLSTAATAALVSAIWEGALLAAVVLLVLRLIPGLSASARSVIWLNVFVLLALLHVVPLFAGSANAPAQALAAHSVHLDARWSLLLAAVWLALSLVRAVQLIAGGVQLRRLSRRAVAIDPGAELIPLLQHGGHRVQLCLSSEVARPSVLGFFEPRVLLPSDLPEKLSNAELRQVVIHEMEHLRRADDWTNLIQKIALVLFPLNPALAWVERRLCAERELACDDSVLRAGPGRKAYALCLTHLAEVALMRRGFSLVLGAWERRPELVRRVQRILSEPARPMGRRTAMAATGSLIAGALGCALVLARAPEVVSFAPRGQMGQEARFAPLDPNVLARDLGGSPQFVKAVMPGQAQAQPEGRAAARGAVTRRVLTRKAGRKAAPAPRLAALRTPPPQAGTLLVMTDFMPDWNDPERMPQVVIAVAPAGQGSHSARIQAAFAVVRTPAGWLVIQI